MSGQIDFDSSDSLKLVDSAYSLSKDYQQVRNNQYERDYKLYQGFVDAGERNPDRANIFIPKIYSIVETKTPRDVKALIGLRPYIPFEARRPEFRDVSVIQTDLLDDYLDRASFYGEFTCATKLKTLYGTSFMEAVPYYEMVTEKVLAPQVMMGRVVGTKIEERQVPRLRFRLRVYAPWEVYVDPFATNLESRGGCRYVIKYQLASRRDVADMAQRGAYPNLDVEKLFNDKAYDSQHKSDHKGLQMLADLGLNQFDCDGDTGVIMRYESPDRYVDVWNGRIVLRDIPNPFKHGQINLSRYIQTVDAHTQNSFWGIGEAKPNEILQSMLNDSWNLTFDNHNMMNQGMIYYRKDSVHPDSLVRTVGNRIAIDAGNDRPIGDSIHESFGESLPRDHYMIPQATERFMDLTSGVWANQRGEQSQGDSTATEQAMLKEYGDLRQELSIRMGEMIFLKSLGEKMLSMLDQLATTDDVVEIVGMERAQLLMTANPADLPGGFNFTFKGANRVANTLMKQRNWKEFLPLLTQIPNVLQGKMAEKFLQIYEVEDADIREMVIPDEVMMQMQQQQMQQQFQIEEAQAQAEHERDMELAKVKGSEKGGVKSKDNNKKSKAKGMTQSKKQPSHSGKSEAQHQAGVTRGHR